MSNETFRVKLVSEAAEYVSISQILHKDFTLHELIGAMLPVVGRDAARIQQMLRVGVVSNGEYRFRWEGREVDAAAIASGTANSAVTTRSVREFAMRGMICGRIGF